MMLYRSLDKVNITVNNVRNVLKKPITETSAEEYDEMYIPAIHCADSK